MKKAVSDEEFRVAYHGDPRDPDSLERASDNRNVLNAVTNRYAGTLTRDEMESCGLQAMWRALQNHRPEFGQKFTTSLHRFAVWECNREVKRVRGRLGRSVPTVPLVDDSLPDRRPDGADVAHIMECLDLIPVDQARLVRQYYLDQMTLVELGRANGVSKETARLRLKRALASLRSACRTGFVGV